MPNPCSVYKNSTDKRLTGLGEERQRGEKALNARTRSEQSRKEKIFISLCGFASLRLGVEFFGSGLARLGIVERSRGGRLRIMLTIAWCMTQHAIRNTHEDLPGLGDLEGLGQYLPLITPSFGCYRYAVTTGMYQ